jgi:hypothetical protein
MELEQKGLPGWLNLLIALILSGIVAAIVLLLV